METKLVCFASSSGCGAQILLFIFLLVMCYTVIVRKHIYMPVRAPGACSTCVCLSYCTSSDEHSQLLNIFAVFGMLSLAVSFWCRHVLYSVACTQVDPDVTEQEERKQGRSERAQLQAEVRPDSQRSEPLAGWL